MVFDNTVIFGVVACYFGFLLFLGIKGYKSTKTFSDYILGGRKLGPVIGAMNVGASDMSSWLLMGLPGAFYLAGLSEVWIIIGLVAGSFASWKLIAVRLRKYTELAGDSLTLSSFLENRFRDKTKLLRIITSVIIVFFFAVYIASGFVGSAKLFSSLFDISYGSALAISCFIIVFYAFIGGFLAVSWADLVQGSLMLATLLIVPIGIAINMGGTSEVFSVIREFSPEHLDPFHNVTFIGLLSTLSWGLGYFGQPHIISKYMAIKEPEKIYIARRICITWMTLSMIGAGLVGLFGYAFFISNPLGQHETVFIVASGAILPAFLMGFVISAILAAIMSTINGQILICSASLTEDFYKRFLRKDASNRELLIVTRVFVILVPFVAFLIARDENATVLGLVAHAWAGLGASIGPVIICALFWQKTTRSGAIAGVVMGALGAIFFAKFKVFPYEMFPAFSLSLISIFIVSLLTSATLSDTSEEFSKIN